MISIIAGWAPNFDLRIAIRKDLVALWAGALEVEDVEQRPVAVKIVHLLDFPRAVVGAGGAEFLHEVVDQAPTVDYTRMSITEYDHVARAQLSLGLGHAGGVGERKFLVMQLAEPGAKRGRGGVAGVLAGHPPQRVVMAPDDGRDRQRQDQEQR